MVKTFAFASAFALTAAGPAHAQAIRQEQPLAVSASSSGGPVTAPNSGMVSRTSSKNLIVRIYNSCFGTNLRGVANPLSPNGNITATLNLKVGEKDVPVTVTYPSMTVTKAGLTQTTPADFIDPSHYTIPNGGRASLFGNIVQIEIPSLFATQVSVTPDGAVDSSLANVERTTLASSSFSQTVVCDGGASYGSFGVSASVPAYPCGQYMGRDGLISASIGGFTVAADQTSADIHVSFPGQTGFCGGYYSPLMLFFDEGRPLFGGVTSFPVNPYGNTHWPTAGEPGYFLTLDRNGDGLITQADELFGDGGKEGWNGFKELATLDKNKDRKIDARDPQFAKLRLWRDLNGDGIAQAGELFTLKKMGVRDISLKYKSGVLRALGEYAQERERSTFTYRKNGKTLKGDIVDIWMSPALQKISER